MITAGVIGTLIGFTAAPPLIERLSRLRVTYACYRLRRDLDKWSPR